MGDAIPGGSSPLSSIPNSEGPSQISLSQTQEAEAEAAAQDQSAEDVKIVGQPPAEDSQMAKETPPPEQSSPSTRPKRTRAAPPLKKDAPKKAAKRTPRKKKKWNAENILSDPKSPLATADLRSLLSNPLAWTLLSSTDKQEILALLPSQTPLIQSADPQQPAQPDIAALRNDDTFRHDCTTYTENLSEGRFETDWLVSAWAAHERRKVGEFDGFLVDKFEETWGVELPEHMKPTRDRRDEKGCEKKGESGMEMGDGTVEEKMKCVPEKEDKDKTSGDQEQAGNQAPLATTESKPETASLGDTQTIPSGDARDRASSADQTMATVSDAATTPKSNSMAQDRASSSDQEIVTPSNAETAHTPKSESTTAFSNQAMSKASDAGRNVFVRGEKDEDGDRMVVDELQVEGSPLKKQQRTPLPNLVQRSNNKMEVDGDSEDELA